MDPLWGVGHGGETLLDVVEGRDVVLWPGPLHGGTGVPGVVGVEQLDSVLALVDADITLGRWRHPGVGVEQVEVPVGHPELEQRVCDSEHRPPAPYSALHDCAVDVVTGDVADGLDQGLGLGVVVHRSAADQLEGRPRIGVVVLGVVRVVFAGRPLPRLRLGRCLLGLAPLLLLAGRSWRSAWGRFGPGADDLVAGRFAQCPVDVPAECHAPQPSEWRARDQSHSDTRSTSRPWTLGRWVVSTPGVACDRTRLVGGVFPSRGRPFTSRRAERFAGHRARLVPEWTFRLLQTPAAVNV